MKTRRLELGLYAVPDTPMVFAICVDVGTREVLFAELIETDDSAKRAARLLAEELNGQRGEVQVANVPLARALAGRVRNCTVVQARQTRHADEAREQLFALMSTISGTLEVHAELEEDPALLLAFYAAAAEFADREPWVHLSGPIPLVIGDRGVLATVRAADEESPAGLVVFVEPRQLLDSDEDQGPAESDTIGLRLVRASAVPEEIADQERQHDVEVRDDAHPLIHITGDASRGLDAVTLLVIAMRTISRFVRRFAGALKRGEPCTMSGTLRVTQWAKARVSIAYPMPVESAKPPRRRRISSQADLEAAALDFANRVVLAIEHLMRDQLLQLPDHIPTNARALLERYARREPADLLRSTKPQIWCAAALHAAFMLQPRWAMFRQVHITIEELAAMFRVSTASIGNKSAALRRDLKTFGPGVLKIPQR